MLRSVHKCTERGLIRLEGVVQRRAQVLVWSLIWAAVGKLAKWVMIIKDLKATCQRALNMVNGRARHSLAEVVLVKMLIYPQLTQILQVKGKVAKELRIYLTVYGRKILSEKVLCNKMRSQKSLICLTVWAKIFISTIILELILEWFIKKVISSRVLRESMIQSWSWLIWLVGMSKSTELRTSTTQAL